MTVCKTDYEDMTTPDRGRYDRRTTPLLSERNAFKVAMAGHNSRGGTWATTSHRAPRATWEESMRLAHAAESAGLDALIGDAAWQALGGHGDLGHWALEPVAWAASLAPVTTRIQLVASVPVAALGTLRVAKASATIDHVSGGRFGLNAIVDRDPGELLIDETTRPVVLCAIGGEPAHDWAARHADVGVMTGVRADDVEAAVRGFKRAAATHGREVCAMVSATLVCGETQHDARRLFEHFVCDLADWDAARALTGRADAPDPDPHADTVERRAVIGRFATPVVGTAEEIAQTLAAWAAAGVDGIAVSWVDYALGLREYDELVLPLLVEAGLRDGERRNGASPR